MFLEIPDFMEVQSPDTREMLGLLDQDSQRRMRNWVRWDQGRGVAPASSGVTLIDYGTQYQTGYFRDPPIPINVCEAEQTQQALLSLPNKFSAPVALFWMSGEEASYRWIGGQCACNHETAKARIIKGHEMLMSEFYQIQARSKATAGELISIGG